MINVVKHFIFLLIPWGKTVVTEPHVITVIYPGDLKPQGSVKRIDIPYGKQSLVIQSNSYTV